MTEHKRKLKRIRRGEKAITRLAGLRLLYKLGGARIWSPLQEISEPAGAGLPWTDCSGCAEYVLAVMGIQLDYPAGWTGTLVQEGLEGESPYFTLFLKEPEETEGHVIMRFRHHPRWRRVLGMAAKWRWAECGGFDNPRSGGGPTWFRPTDARVAEFPYRRRFAEL